MVIDISQYMSGLSGYKDQNNLSKRDPYKQIYYIIIYSLSISVGLFGLIENMISFPI